MPHPRIRIIQHFIGLRLTPGAQALVQFCIMLGKDLRGEQAGVRSASFADGQRADRNAARHLHNGVEAVDTA
jgi:hypothetical protein